MGVDVVLGLQWGDEGKGKIVDFLATDYDLVCRFQGGPNAGHTLKIDGDKHVLHTIPSGIFRKHLINVIGNGVVIDPITLQKEIDQLLAKNLDFLDRLLVSNKAHLILPTHRWLDAASEASKGKAKIGSTLRGIGPTYMDKTGRNGLRFGDIFTPDFEDKYILLVNKHKNLLNLYPNIPFNFEEEEEKWMKSIQQLKSLQRIDCEYYLNEAMKEGKKILAEGAQGSMLDIDFGTYPFVTSSNTITAGVCTGLGIAPSKISRVIGITKAYCTRVGSGPFPSELHDEEGEKLRNEGSEFGATTGRPRRCGWIDIPQLKYTMMLNGVTELCITKIDILNNFDHFRAADQYFFNSEKTDLLPFDIDTTEIDIIHTDFEGWNCSLEGIRQYSNLPDKAVQYIEYLEHRLDTKIQFISTGPERESLIIR